jgi:integrase
MKTKIVIHEKRIKIYFREGSHFVRYNTGIPVFSRSEFYRNDPQNLFNPISPEYIEFNNKIKLAQGLIEDIIDDNLGKTGIILNNEFIRKRITNTHNEKAFTKKFLLEYYQDFLTYKIKYYQDNNSSKLSGKDYTSLKQSLIDYHLWKNEVYNIEDLSYDWVKSFLSFLTEKRNKYIDKTDVDGNVLDLITRILKSESEKKFRLRFANDKIRLITQGELCDNTIQKRFDNLNEFIKYLYKKKIITWYPEDISDLRKLYKSYMPDFTTLTRDETKKLYEFKINYDYDDKRYEFVRDVFIFMSLTSFRFSDVVTFNKERNIEGNKIKKYPQKTEKFDAVSIIDIQPVVKSILEKYDYKLDRYGNTLFNRYLSECLEKSGMFNETFYKKKRIKGRPVQLPGITRYQALSTHSGRRTCITNLISNGFELARIRTISGHSSDRMLLRYYDAFRQNNSDNSDLTKSLDFTSDQIIPEGDKK